MLDRARQLISDIGTGTVCFANAGAFSVSLMLHNFLTDAVLAVTLILGVLKVVDWLEKRIERYRANQKDKQKL